MKQINLVPFQFKKVIYAVRNVAIVAEIFAITLLLIMGLVGFFPDVTTAVLFSIGILSVTTPMLIPGLLYEQISQSTVEVMTDRINVLDRNRRCWREIVYDSITDIRIEEISGFFYGKDKYLCTEKYICFYLNGNTEIPSVSYAKLYKAPNFFMVSYDVELQNLLKQVSNKF